MSSKKLGIDECFQAVAAIIKVQASTYVIVKCLTGSRSTLKKLASNLQRNGGVTGLKETYSCKACFIDLKALIFQLIYFYYNKRY